MKWKSLRHISFCNPMGYTAHGISPARMLVWVAFPFSRGSFEPTSPALQADSLPAEPEGKPKMCRKWDAVGLSLLSGPLHEQSEEINMWGVCAHTSVFLAPKLFLFLSSSFEFSLSVSLYFSVFLSLSILLFYLYFCLSLLKNPGFLLVLLIPIQLSRTRLSLSRFHVCNLLLWLWETERCLFTIARSVS